jgi:hypothetical protein
MGLMFCYQARNLALMTGGSRNEFMARYFADMKDESCKQLAAEDLIARFTVMAELIGVVLNADSFDYFQTTGIVVKAKGIAWKFLGPITAERDGLLPFNDIAARLPPSRFGGGVFLLVLTLF